MSYFWSTFIQPLYEEENPQKSQQPRPQPRPRLQHSQPTPTTPTTLATPTTPPIPKPRPEVDPNASVPTAKAFEPVYVTRKVKPQLTVVVPPPPPPPPPSPSPSSIKEEEVEETCCTPDVKCNSSFSSTDVNNSMPSLVDSEDECTPNFTNERQFVYDGDMGECSTPPLITFDCELNKYNIQAQCTPQVSAYNSPRLSADKLYMFDWEPKYTTVNHGVFNNTMVNGGHCSAPPSPTLKRVVRDDTKTLEEMESELNHYIFELEQLRQKFEKLSFKLFDLQTDF